MTNHPGKKTINQILGRNSVHPFPARMAPDLALGFVPTSRKPMRILDPMSGSGTVLAVASSKGHHVIGVDIDPLSVLTSRVWITKIDIKKTRSTAAKIMERARCTFRSIKTRDAYPVDSDDETRRFVRYWFDDYARRQLAALVLAIREVPAGMVRDTLWCAFSRLIITKQSGASLAMDLSHSRPHRVFKRAPSKPFRKFLPAVNQVIKNCVDNRAHFSGLGASVHEGDARNLPIDDKSIDLVLTSPPYLNAIDYLRCSKFSLVWMGYSVEHIRRIRTTSIGAEIGIRTEDDEQAKNTMIELSLWDKLVPRQRSILSRYIHDMSRVIEETSRVLACGGKAIYVVGENTIRGTFIPNAKILEAIARETKLSCISRKFRKLPPNRRYLPPPSARSGSSSFNKRMQREAILTFKKVA